jgi:hypothetical protein
MDCSSDESSELSDTDIDDYAEKVYMDLKSGKLVAKLGLDVCTTPRKKNQDYRYNELLQHAIGVGASNRAANVKANYQAVANLLKTDHADAAGSLCDKLKHCSILLSLCKIKSCLFIPGWASFPVFQQSKQRKVEPFQALAV